MTDLESPAPVRRTQRLPRWVKITVSVCLVLALILFGARWFVASSAGRSLIEKQIESRVFSGQTVSIDGFEGDVLSSFSISRITLKDNEGVWAELEDVKLRWAAMSLLSRHLQVSEFTFGSIDLQRRPNLPAQEAPPDSTSDMPLKAITLNGFEIHRFTLREGLTPQEVTGSVTGDARWTPADAQIRLDMRPGEGSGDRLTLKAGWSESAPLNGTLDLTGPENGLFATLLQTNAQSVSAAFAASGTASTIQGEGTVRLGDAPWITLVIAPETAGYRVSSEIDLTLHPLTAPHIAQTGPSLTLSALLDQSPGQTEPLKTLSVSTKTLSMDMDQFVLGGARKSIHVVADLKDPSALLPPEQLEVSTARLDGTLFLPDDNSYRFEGTAGVTGLKQAQIGIRTLSGPVTAEYKEQTLNGRLDLLARDVTLRPGETETRLSSAQLTTGFSYQTGLGDFRLDETSLRTPKSQIRLTGQARLKDALTLETSGTGQIDLRELGLYEAGFVDARWSLKQSEPDRQSFSANVTARQLVADGNPLQPWLGETASLTASGELISAKTLTLSQLNVSTPEFSLSGSGTADTDRRIAFDGSLTTTETYPLQDTLSGLTGTFRVSGTADDLVLGARFAARRAGSGETALDDLTLDFKGRWRDAVLSGQTSLKAGLREAPLSLETEIAYDEGRWRLSDLQGLWQSLRLSGQLSGDGGDLTSLQGDLELSGALPDGLPATDTRISARIKGENITSTGRLTGIEAGPLSNGNLSFDVSGTFAALVYDLKLTGMTDMGSFPQTTALNLTGRAVGLDTATPVMDGQVNAQIGTQRFVTTEPFRLAQTPDGLQAAIRLTGLGGTLAVDLDEAETTPLSLSLQNIGLAPVMTLIGNAPVRGRSDLSLTVSRQGETLSARVTGQLRDVSVPQSNASPVSFLLNGDISSGGGKFILRTPEGQMLQALADISAPVTTREGLPYLSYDDAKPGLVSLTLIGPVDNMSALFLSDTQSVRGVIRTDLKLPLPFAPDTVTGSLSFADGVFQHEILGTDLEQINFAVSIQDGALSLSDFTAKGRNGGTLEGSGGVKFGSALESSLALTADRLVVVNRKEARAVASGTMGLDLTAKAIRIIGDLTVNEGVLRLDSLPASSAPTLNVTFDTEKETSTTERQLVSLDISVKAPRNLKLVGRGMDAELSLDSKIEGTGSDIRLTGRAKVVRGRFELLGKRFDFQESNIEFRGDPMQASLNIVASRAAGDFTAKVTITGTPELPEITLSAEPVLPEDEVLSRVLFGRSPSQLTALEAARLAAAIASLSGSGGGFDLMGGIENLTGFDNVEVGQNQDGQFQVATGRYLSEDVYMELTSGGSGAPGVSVEWEARENISVEAETKPGQGQTLSVQWKRDFD